MMWKTRTQIWERRRRWRRLWGEESSGRGVVRGRSLPGTFRRRRDRGRMRRSTEFTLIVRTGRVWRLSGGYSVCVWDAPQCERAQRACPLRRQWVCVRCSERFGGGVALRYAWNLSHRFHTRTDAHLCVSARAAGGHLIRRSTYLKTSVHISTLREFNIYEVALKNEKSCHFFC